MTCTFLDMLSHENYIFCVIFGVLEADLDSISIVPYQTGVWKQLCVENTEECGFLIVICILENALVLPLLLRKWRLYWFEILQVHHWWPPELLQGIAESFVSRLHVWDVSKCGNHWSYSFKRMLCPMVEKIRWIRSASVFWWLPLVWFVLVVRNN